MMTATDIAAVSLLTLRGREEESISLARILVISSQVAYGHVGLSAIVPALHALGHKAIALPTIMLSNHPGHPSASGTRISPEVLRKMMDSLHQNRFLDQIDTVLSGYLPTPESVAFVRDTVSDLKSSQQPLTYVCDPILGDLPKGLYIDQTAADAIRDMLIPLADLIVPNAFELGWLTGRRIRTADEAEKAARLLGPERCVVTSVPITERELANIDIRRSAPPQSFAVTRRSGVPNGTGDLLAGLLAAGLPLNDTVDKLEALIEMSIGRPELALVEAIGTWRR